MGEGVKNTGIKRRQYYINKGFQTRFILRFFLILVLGGVVTVGLTLVNTQDTLTSTYVDSKLVIQSTSLAIMPSVIFTVLITTGILCVVAVLVTLLASHKIAGPIYRFEKDIAQVAEGNLRHRIRIRKNDQFQELAVSLNRMIDGLSLRISAVKDEAEALGTQIDSAARVRDKIDENFRL